MGGSQLDRLSSIHAVQNAAGWGMDSPGVGVQPKIGWSRMASQSGRGGVAG